MIHLPTFEDLKDFVRNVLCTRADLDLFTPMLESTIFRRDRPCGIEYTLLAPRSIRLSAIWEAVEDRVLFYDQDLIRFQISEVEGPSPQGILNRPREQVAVRSLWKGK